MFIRLYLLGITRYLSYLWLRYSTQELERSFGFEKSVIFRTTYVRKFKKFIQVKVFPRPPHSFPIGAVLTD